MVILRAIVKFPFTDEVNNGDGKSEALTSLDKRLKHSSRLTIAQESAFLDYCVSLTFSDCLFYLTGKGFSSLATVNAGFLLPDKITARLFVLLLEEEAHGTQISRCAAATDGGLPNHVVVQSARCWARSRRSISGVQEHRITTVPWSSDDFMARRVVFGVHQDFELSHPGRCSSDHFLSIPSQNIEACAGVAEACFTQPLASGLHKAYFFPVLPCCVIQQDQECRSVLCSSYFSYTIPGSYNPNFAILSCTQSGGSLP